MSATGFRQSYGAAVSIILPTCGFVARMRLKGSLIQNYFKKLSRWPFPGSAATQTMKNYSNAYASSSRRMEA